MNHTNNSLGTRYLSILDIFTIGTGGTLQPATSGKTASCQFPRYAYLQQIPAQPLFLFEMTPELRNSWQLRLQQPVSPFAAAAADMAARAAQNCFRGNGQPATAQSRLFTPPAAFSMQEHAARERALKLAATATQQLIEWITTKEMMASHLIKQVGGDFNRLTLVQKIAFQNAGKQVHFLDLSGVQLTSASIKNIQAYFPNLRNLIANSSQLTDESVNLLKGCRHLTRLSIEVNPQLTDNALLSISEVPTLQELCLSGGNYSNQGISRLQKLERLTSLHLKTYQFIDELSVAINNLPSLQELHLVNCGSITGADAQAFIENNSLQKLTYANCSQLDAEMIQTLSMCYAERFSLQEQPLKWGRAAPLLNLASVD